jgi:hypothetical protein
VLGRVCVGRLAVCARPRAAVKIVSATTRNFLNKISLLFVKIATHVHRGQRDYVDFDKHVFRQT